MTYNRKLSILLCLCAGLVLVYLFGTIFSGSRRSARSESYNWLEPKFVSQLDRITMVNPDETVILVRRNNQWFVLNNENEYPARQLRVTDFINLFTKRADYPVRSRNASSHQQFGVTGDSALRVVFSGGVGSAFLDLLIGQGDATGQNVYLRKQGQNEVRSGEDKFSAYIYGSLTSWYNLRLVPETEDGRLDVNNVQRLSVYSGGGDAEPKTFTRRGKEWILSGMNVAKPDMSVIDSYVRTVLYIEGDDFSNINVNDAQSFGDSRIVLELGTGRVVNISLSAPDEEGRLMAMTSDNGLVYSLQSRTAERLFLEDSFFAQED